MGAQKRRIDPNDHSDDKKKFAIKIKRRKRHWPSTAKRKEEIELSDFIEESVVADDIVESHNKSDLITETAKNLSRAELLENAEYADILVGLLDKPYEIRSVSKIVFIAFCVEHNYGLSVYRNRQKDLIQTFMSSLSLKLISHIDEIETIMSQLHLLENNNWIEIAADGKIKILSTDIDHLKSHNKFLNYFIGKSNNPIKAVNQLDDKAFLEEVVRYV
jgi:hypothetical protein